MARQSRIDSPGALHRSISRGRKRYRVKARSVLAYWALHESGMSVTDVGLKLGLSQSVTGRTVQRGRGIAEATELNLGIANKCMGFPFGPGHFYPGSQHPLFSIKTKENSQWHIEKF